MSSRLVKCYGTCEQKHPQSIMQKFKSKNYCPACYKKKVKEVEDRENLYNKCKEVFGISFPTGLMLRQIKQFKEERGYTYKNIGFALDYIVRIKKIQLELKYGLALIPHYYDEMIDYYKDLKRRRENMVVKKIETQKVQIKPPSLSQNRYRDKKLINMEDLLK
ncbi:Bacteriophage related protein (plasmid) [Bacillus subtilis]|uniref:Uncharacterized protein n=1 Tax=Bacillus subtilis subsp. subtilis NCIB 3610 = ATCC 6051 = DSM 10 TaxID=535026 RepID=S5DQ25_BACIU|nr:MULTISPECIES: hypothetical protein [Bacillus]AGQ21298.1 unknown [Bacillus subtilis subsp. subtilis NCIB 3610 = ATCC 6051 = DSM 10]AJO60848.1 hypothetical protein QF06_20535 [Bacillus sp. YP1]AQZ93208.1 hypothetical protein B4U62_22405 [Bacillus subtilis]KAA0930157.1 hypothetical protein FQ086_21665 [Bacillus sp. ANT_WA51]KNB75909.1 hypothetical protein ACR57_20960 [Bacillus subtilis]